MSDVRNYKYGARAPIGGMEIVEEQFRLAHAYRNRLVEIELVRRAGYRRACRETSETVRMAEAEEAAAEAAREEAYAAVMACRQDGKTRKVHPGVMSVYTDARQRYRDACNSTRTARRKAAKMPVTKATIQVVNDNACAAIKRAYHESPLWWATKNFVKGTVKTEGRPPRFHRWTGDGIFAMQIINGLSIDEAMSCRHRWLQIEPVPDNAWDNGQPRRLQYTTLRMRVASDGKAPIWASIPIRLHRPLPGGRIKWVYLMRRSIAAHYRWHVVIVLEDPPDRKEYAEVGTVAINCGWRQLDHGVRVAYWRDETGREGQLVIGERDLSRWDRADSLRGTRDANFNRVRAQLAEWLRAHDHPDWLRRRTATLNSWRSCARLASVVLAWRDARFPGDAEVFAALEAWRQQDKHLWEWEANQRRKAVAWRDTMYRQWADEMARKYATAIVGLVDYSRLARRAQPDEKDDSTTQSRGNRFDAAPGRLTEYLLERFAMGSKVTARNITQRCPLSGKLDRFDAAHNLERTCECCGVTLDQDARACRNLLGTVPPIREAM